MEEDKTNFGYWKAVLDDMPQSYREWFEAERKFLGANVPWSSRVIEIGCGDGRSLEGLSDMKQIFGIDNNPLSVMEAMERFREWSNVSIVLGDGRNTSFRDNWFDRVLCLTTPANFGYERELFYREMRRLVKPDGEILLSVFNEDDYTFEERKKLYEKLEAPMQLPDMEAELKYKMLSYKGERPLYLVGFDYPNGASRSEQFYERGLRKILRENKLHPIEIRKEGIGYFVRAIK